MDTFIKHVPELNFTICATVREYRVDFEIYDIYGFLNGETNSPFWIKIDAEDNSDITNEICDAQYSIHGHVKWDGCSNWYFDEQDKGMLHACTRQGVQRYGDILAMCWDWTAELLPKFRG